MPDRGTGRFRNHWRDAKQFAPRYYWHGWCLIAVGVAVDLAAIVGGSSDVVRPAGVLIWLGMIVVVLGDRRLRQRRTEGGGE